MEWTDNGIVLGVRPHGETHAIVDVFTPSAGRCPALVHGGQSRTKQPILQPGNGVKVVWKGRGESSLGHYAVELITPRAATLMHERLSLLALSSVCQTLALCLAEREAVPRLYEATCVLLDLMEETTLWPIIYAKWELGLLDNLGAGLDLTRCVATGLSVEDGAVLAFMSPKSAGAVSFDAGLPYKDKLLPLPAFLTDQGEPTKADVLAALNMTGYFLEERVFVPGGKKLPEARAAMMDRLKHWSLR